jgi:hypothetical protein
MFASSTWRAIRLQQLVWPNQLAPALPNGWPTKMPTTTCSTTWLFQLPRTIRWWLIGTTSTLFSLRASVTMHVQELG